ncbi:MAG: hypothetical protein QG670_2544 [Thermoproteota archaeon]|nr:hypothetical protein [Thermoproteota archaeon]
MYVFGSYKQVQTFLEIYVKDKIKALFYSRVPENAPELQGWIQKLKNAAVGANIVDNFNY